MILHPDSFDNYATGNLLDYYTQVYGLGTFTMPTVGAYGRRGTQGVRFTAVAVGGPDQNNPGALSVVLNNTEDTMGAGIAVQFTGSFGTLSGLSEWGLDSSVSPVSSLGNTTQNGIPITCLLLFRNSGFTQVAITINRDGTLSAVRGSGIDNVLAHDLEKVAEILGTSIFALQTATYYYIEAKVLISATVGTVEIRVNGDVWLNLSGVNTKPATTNAYTTELAVGMLRDHVLPGAPSYLDVDDLVYWNTDASVPTNTTVDFLGDVDLTYLPPVEDVLRGWTPLSGIEHYEMVDEIPPDDDTSYNYTDSVGAIDTFLTSGAPLNVDIIAVSVVYDRRRTTGGNTTTSPIWRVGGTSYDRTAVGDPSTYTYNQGTWTLNPATMGAITKAAFDVSSIGYKKVS